MNILIPSLAGLVVFWLVWLVVTPRVKFPLLFDLGLALITLGTVVLADGALHEELNHGGALLFGGGLAVLLASYARQTHKYNREHRYGKPREIDGRDLGNIPGGKR